MRVVLVEQRAPTGVAELGGSRGGAHDVGEEDGGQHPVRVVRRSGAGEELLDLVHELVGVLGEPEVVGAVELHVPGVGDLVRQVPPELGPRDLIMRSLEHQGRGLDDREQLADVGQHRLPVVVRDGTGRDRAAPEPDELLREAGIVGPARARGAPRGRRRRKPTTAPGGRRSRAARPPELPTGSRARRSTGPPC